MDADRIALITAEARAYDHFNGNIEPCGEHDMGLFTVCGKDHYWMVDY